MYHTIFIFFQYLETMQAKYFKQAREKGVYVVEACGFDSIPGDYGISLLKKEFPGRFLLLHNKCIIYIFLIAKLTQIFIAIY